MWLDSTRVDTLHKCDGTAHKKRWSTKQQMCIILVEALLLSMQYPCTYIQHNNYASFLILLYCGNNIPNLYRPAWKLKHIRNITMCTSSVNPLRTIDHFTGHVAQCTIIPMIMASGFTSGCLSATQKDDAVLLPMKLSYQRYIHCVSVELKSLLTFQCMCEMSLAFHTVYVSNSWSFSLMRRLFLCL